MNAVQDSRCAARGESELAAFFGIHATTMKIEPGTTIAHQCEPARSAYRIVRGCVRSAYYTQEGDRKILQFLGAGDYLGLGDAPHWSAAQEAVDTVVLEAVPRTVFEAALRHDCMLQGAVRHNLAREVEAHAALLVLTAQTTAVDRVRLFLERHASRRGNSGFVVLPMGRRDIADHLGLSMETVSRAFSTLKAHGDIALRGASFFRLAQRDGDDGGLANAA